MAQKDAVPSKVDDGGKISQWIVKVDSRARSFHSSHIPRTGKNWLSQTNDPITSMKHELQIAERCRMITEMQTQTLLYVLEIQITKM